MDYSSGFDTYGSTYDPTYGSSYGSNGDVEAAVGGIVAGLGALGIGAIILGVIFSIIVLAVCLWIHSRYFKKMGYSPWLALLKLIPLADFFMFFYFAFVTWPVEKSVHEVVSNSKKIESKE